MNAALPPAERLARRLIGVLFVLALAYNLWGVSVGWHNLNLPGHEFRQAQTGISALFIQRDHDFSLAYPTPVLGPPWSVPFEFPLYQWTVVVVSNGLHLPLTEAARGVSAACFYLALVPLALLLRRLGLGWSRAAVVLTLVLTCPLYIFYSRAFLIETMALMFGLWYLHALVTAMERRSVPWLVVAALASAGAGLVKVTTFIVCLVPAFAWCVTWLWAARPRAGAPGWAPLLRTFGWLAGLHAVPFAATVGWVRYADAVKLRNPAAAYLTSDKLSAFNFGLGQRLNPQVWSDWLAHLTGYVAGLPVLGATLVLACFAGRWRWHAFACLALGFVALLIFPVLYAIHSYYHVASAFLFAAGLGFALCGLLDKRLPRWVPLAAWGFVLALQVNLYLTRVYPEQHTPGNAGGLVDALQSFTDEDRSLIIAGNDWNSITPYYAGRKALMLHSTLPRNEAYLEKAFASMQGQQVGALILMGLERDNTQLLARALRTFDLHPQPLFTWAHGDQTATVYLDRQLRPNARAIFARRGFYEVTPIPPDGPEPNPLIGQVYPYAKLHREFRKFFRTMSPAPVRFYSTFGPELWNENQPGEERFAANPDTKLWFALPPGPHRLRTDLQIEPGSWENVALPDASDGVELTADAVFPDGRRERLQSRYFFPRERAGDRGRQPVDWTFTLPAGAELEIAVNPGPAQNAARDWATLGHLTIQ